MCPIHTVQGLSLKSKSQNIVFFVIMIVISPFKKFKWDLLFDYLLNNKLKEKILFTNTMQITCI